MQSVSNDPEISAGQVTPFPVHCSDGSHGPMESRHVVAEDWKESDGQRAAFPVHCS